jgi:hypothetical protein
VTSSFTGFQQEFLVAIYDLTERTGEQMVRTGEVIKNYPVSHRPNWIMRALFDFKDRGLVEDTFTHDGELEQSVWLTAAGMREAEYLFEGGVMLVHADDMRKQEASQWTDISDMPTEYLNDKNDLDGVTALEKREAIKVDSTSWTGFPKDGLLDQAAATRLQAGLRLVDLEIDKFKGTNEQRSQARAFFVALQAFSEAPEPPADLIWQIVDRASQLSGIASLFVSVIALFQAAVH